ncbi:MAG: hypothetical protein RJB26_672 [Pseudomonadota bacterium]
MFVLREPAHAAALHAFLKANAAAMAAQGRPLAVTVTEAKAKRSTEQNRRYWALLGEIAEHAWVAGRQFSADAWHEHFKGLYIGLEDLPDGRRAALSSAPLSVADFGEYMDKIEAYAAQTLGLTLEMQA